MLQVVITNDYSLKKMTNGKMVLISITDVLMEILAPTNAQICVQPGNYPKSTNSYLHYLASVVPELAVHVA